MVVTTMSDRPKNTTIGCPNDRIHTGQTGSQFAIRRLSRTSSTPATKKPNAVGFSTAWMLPTNQRTDVVIHIRATESKPASALGEEATCEVQPHLACIP